MKKTVALILIFLLFYAVLFAQTPKEVFDQGVVLFKKNQYQKAIDTFSELIKLVPDHADAFKNRGVSYMKLEKFDLAIADFQMAKKIFPKLQGLYSNLGVAWYYKKEYEKAIQNYTIELDMTPENYVAYFNRALCLAELGKNSDALVDLEKALNIRPEFYWALCYKADLLALKGDIIKARDVYNDAIKYSAGDTYANKKAAKLNQIIKKDTTKQKTKNKKHNIKKTNPNNKHKIDNQLLSAKTKPLKIKNSHTALQNKELYISGFTIQAGGFLNPNNAIKMKTKLYNMGFDSRILILKGAKEKIWYFVRSGRYDTKKNTQKDYLLLKEKLGFKPAIRPIGKW